MGHFSYPSFLKVYGVLYRREELPPRFSSCDRCEFWSGERCILGERSEERMCVEAGPIYFIWKKLKVRSDDEP